MLYKYRAINNNRYTVDLIRNNELFFDRYCNFNDPFDSVYAFEFDNSFYEDPVRYANEFILNYVETRDYTFAENARQMIYHEWQSGNLERVKRWLLDAETQSFDNETDYDIGVYCLSHDYSNILMWSHYAQNHTGIVLGFDEELLLQQLPYHLTGDVVYPESDELPTRNLHSLRNGDLQEQAKQYFFKSHFWKYEKEFRILLMGDPGVYHFPAEALKEVYLGCKISDDDKNLVEQLVNEKDHNIRIYTSKKCNNKYRLDFNCCQD